MIIGIWANVNGKNYVVITDDGGQFTEVSVLIIVVGLFVMMVGAVGVGGAIFAHTMCGRITLALVSGEGGAGGREGGWVGGLVGGGDVMGVGR